MNKLLQILFLSILAPNFLYAEESACGFFTFCGASRTSSKTLPSTSAAGNLNPSTLSKVRGFGLETTYQPGNAPLFNLVSGNGKIGALISPTQENTFFGNRPIEIDEVYGQRQVEQKQYENKKLSLSAGLTLVDKKNVGLDLGVSVKRNPDIKKLNPGAGLSAKLFFLNFGAYIYNDDVKIELGNHYSPYNQISYFLTHQSATYQENFTVKTYTMGMNIKNLSLDVGIIKTRYDFYPDDTSIMIISGSYLYNKFLVYLAQRKEESPNQHLLNSILVIQREKTEMFYGLHYMANKHLTVGLNYNNFLLHEVSIVISLYL